MAAESPTPKHYWETYVYPNYKDFSVDQGSLQKAMNAALTVYHFHDWVWLYYFKSDPSKIFNIKNKKDFLTFLVKNHCDDLGILEDIVNLHKHLGRPRDGGHAVSSHTERIESFGGAPLGSFTLGSDVLAGEAVTIALDNGEDRIFFMVVRSVVEMWESLNKQLQLF